MVRLSFMVYKIELKIYSLHNIKNLFIINTYTSPVGSSFANLLFLLTFLHGRQVENPCHRLFYYIKGYNDLKKNSIRFW